jgi:hypothetical protein
VSQELLTLGVHLDPGEATDDVELEQMRLQVREQLLELDVHAVESAPVGPPPAGTRGLDLLAGGALLVSLSKSPELLKMVVSILQSWAASRPARSVELVVGGNSLKVTGISSDEQQRLIDLFVEQSARR